MPTQGTETIVYGAVSMDMLTELKLQPIQVRLLPAETIYRCYLDYSSQDKHRESFFADLYRRSADSRHAFIGVLEYHFMPYIGWQSG